MATATATPQTNGVLPSSSSGPSNSQAQGNSTQLQSTPSQSQPSTQQQNQQSLPPSQSQSQIPQSQSQPTQPQQQQQQHQQHQQQQQSTPPNTTAPRPRDARTLELLLTAQGVTAFESRVPLLLLDFAYRHTSSVLSDALHLAADPYTSHAGARPSAASGAAPVNVGDAAVSANAVQLAIASRLGYQFRGGGGGGPSGSTTTTTTTSGGGGGGGAGAGGVSKDWMMELARERNRVALPSVPPQEWGVRLPNERFVLGGVSWGLKDPWTAMGDGDSSSEGEDDGDGGAEGDAMEGVETSAGAGAGAGAGEGEDEEDGGGEGVEGGTMADVFGDDLEDEEMAEQ